jgi:dTDP-4-dehydrorhamnose 3,5-epimerase
MQIEKTDFEGVFIIKPKVFLDKRGYFMETYKKKEYDFLKVNFVQDNLSKSKKNVLRGLHFQKPPFAQDKLVSVVKGAVLDVIVDLRKNQKTFGKYFAVKLSAKNKKQLFIPKGFAHGFVSLKKGTIFTYKCSNVYHAYSEVSINPLDEKLNINWQVKNLIISEKDKKGIDFSTLESPFN